MVQSSNEPKAVDDLCCEPADPMVIEDIEQLVEEPTAAVENVELQGLPDDIIDEFSEPMKQAPIEVKLHVSSSLYTCKRKFY